MTSNYFEIIEALRDFLEDNLDKRIGDLTQDEVRQLADNIDNAIRKKEVK